MSVLEGNPARELYECVGFDVFQLEMHLELVIHDPAAVRAFLRDHESILAARVKREVTNKLETGLKNP